MFILLRHTYTYLKVNRAQWYFWLNNTTIYSSVITGLFQKKSKQQGWGNGISWVIGWRKSTWKLQGSKKEVRFSGVIKKFMWNFNGSWFLDGVGISKGCSKISWNFQRWSFVFSGIPKSKATTLNIPGIFPKKYVLAQLPLLEFFLE